MKSRRLLILFAALFAGMLMLLAGCKGKEGPDDKPVKLEPAGNVVAKYTKDDTDYSKLPEEATKTLRLHYRRNDDSYNDRACYDAWNVWAWDMTNGGNGAAYEFTGYDDYGVYVDLDLKLLSENRPISQVGFIIRTDNWAKDPDGDRSIDILPESPGGLQNAWVRTTESTVFYTEENALKSIVSYALLRDSKTISVYFKPLAADFKTYAPRFSVEINGEAADFTMGEYDPSTTRSDLTLKQDIDLCDVVTIGYRFDPTWTCKVGLMMTNYYNTEEFNERYAYDGEDLGATFDNEENPSATTFKVWAPTSSKMLLNLYNSGDYMTETEPAAVYEMEKGEKGVFSYTVAEDLDGKYYTYTVTNSKGTNEVVDPYAKSAGVNGRRGMVINFTKLNKELAGWNEDARPFSGNAVDAVIYEAHVRDMTIDETSGVTKEYRGRFPGLAESGTTYTEGGVTVSTGLDHLKELGITHLQLQPFYDYSSVDETKSGTDLSEDNYNWGYDPLNYNVLEGSYSTDPYDGYVRVREFKQMVMALHQAGISINMDVVYNHTANSENSNFNLLVPYYYYRTKANGAFYNGSGCGNELASERYMVNKYFRESCRFWIDEYHLSGFRFDLMGLIDNQTMIDIYKDCSAIYPEIMIYGEPWTGGASKLTAGVSDTKLKEQTTVQESLAQDFFCGSGVLVGAFNDVIRNAARGDNSPGKGFVQGSSGDASMIAMCAEGLFSKGTVKTQAINPNQVLNYVACHDNYTLYDQLVQTVPEEKLEAAYTQADSIIFFAEGVPFIQEGEEFMRSKRYADTGKYEGNSYNVGDSINLMDYSLKIEHQAVFEKTKEMIALRKDHPEFRLASREEINARFIGVEFDNTSLRYQIDGLVVIHTSLSMTAELDGSYEIIYSNLRDTPEKVSGSVSLSAGESVVLQKEQ
ncbi:MAG: type I pullulanase [Lachnospiraceae bacterium]|nr:type I pullulanase [Lachnospiraceae bacterium]